MRSGVFRAVRNMRFVLPNLTPDLGGAASMLLELGGMAVFHDAAGCCENYAAFDEPRLIQGGQMIYSSSLLQMDAVLGNDEPLISGVVQAAEQLKPRFIALLGTPVPSVTGMDLEGMAAEIEAQTGISSFAVPTGGFASYTQGAGEALCRLLKRFARVDAAVPKTGVNLLGVTPLDFDERLLERIKRTLASLGKQVRSVLCLGASMQDVISAPMAEENIVVSAAGLKAARFLQEAFGMSYDVYVPLQQEHFEAGSERDTSCLVIGEEMMARALSEALSARRGWRTSFLSDAVSEQEIEQAAQQKDVVVADPLIRPLVPPSARFIDCPHRALSAHLFEDRSPGSVIDALLDE